MDNSAGEQAGGLYNEPTAAQVERLIAAARGEEYRPPEKAPLYSKPTYSQFERLIAAVRAGGGAGFEPLKGSVMPEEPSQAELTVAVQAMFRALGGTIEKGGGDE